jgi:hypothetical protein
MMYQAEKKTEFMDGGYMKLQVEDLYKVYLWIELRREMR